MRASDRYLKVVEWSEEDNCYIGRCPGLILGGVHGDDETKVFKELCQAVEESIEIMKQDREPLPEPTAGKKYSGKFVLRMDEDLHRAVALLADHSDQSLNNYIVRILKSSIEPRKGATSRARSRSVHR